MGAAFLGIALAPALIEGTAPETPAAGPPYLANGLKVGEVTTTGAIVWTRLTTLAAFKTDGLEFAVRRRVEDDEDLSVMGPEHGYSRQVPPGRTLEDMNTVVPGMAGDVRLTYWAEGRAGAPIEVGWTPVDASRDYTAQFPLDGLIPATRYRLRVEGRAPGGGASTASVEGTFATAPLPAVPARVLFTVVTCSRWDSRDDLANGQRIYPRMAALQPDFFVHAGDIVYYDSPSPWVTHVDLARLRWNRMYALPFVRDFHQGVASYFMKDDHDFWHNDAWPGMESRKMGVFTWQQGQRVFLEQVPMGDKTYRTIRWGKDLQVWMVEGRDFRSPNTDPDGPAKTIWGREQLDWFKRTVSASDATFRLLISPTPLVGPDHRWKAKNVDNHVDAGRAFEGNLLREFVGSQRDMYVVTGDRHWQYVSEDPRTGVREFGAGPTTDAHVDPLDNDDRRNLKFIREKGGFLSVTVERRDGVPVAIFRHHDVSGAVQHEDVRRAR
jgi:alkaline phosphatase D